MDVVYYAYIKQNFNVANALVSSHVDFCSSHFRSLSIGKMHNCSVSKIHLLGLS